LNPYAYWLFLTLRVMETLPLRLTHPTSARLASIRRCLGKSASQRPLRNRFRSEYSPEFEGTFGRSRLNVKTAASVSMSSSSGRSPNQPNVNDCFPLRGATSFRLRKMPRSAYTLRFFRTTSSALVDILSFSPAQNPAIPSSIISDSTTCSPAQLFQGFPAGTDPEARIPSLPGS